MGSRGLLPSSKTHPFLLPLTAEKAHPLPSLPSLCPSLPQTDCPEFPMFVAMVLLKILFSVR